jgi:hypothetical protein
MLPRRDLVADLRVTNLAGQPVEYSTIWQHKTLVLVVIPASDPDGAVDRYASPLAAHMQSCEAADAAGRPRKTEIDDAVIIAVAGLLPLVVERSKQDVAGSRGKRRSERLGSDDDR